jgi:hypothetical protein
MPALVITGSQVLPGTGTGVLTRNAAEAITPGQALYVNATNQWALAQCDGTVLEAAVGGIALNGASAGQPVTAATAGPVTLGAAAAPAVGQVYALGTPFGAIVPYSDLVTTNRVTLLGWGIAANAIQLAIQNTGVAKA